MGSLKASFRRGRFPPLHTWGNRCFYPCFFSMLGCSLHRWTPSRGRRNRRLRVVFPTRMWETILQLFIKSIANALPHTRVGDRMPGKNRGKKRKTQYCLPYTRRGNQLWQPICPFLRFLPYTYGEAPTLMTRPSPAMSSSLRVRGSPLVARRCQNRKLVFPTLRGSSLSRPVPMLLTPPFGRPEASPHAPRARQCCVPVWTGFHGGGSFPARFLLCSLQETAMRNSVGTAGCRFAKEYT